jgi:hypothetical protein
LDARFSGNAARGTRRRLVRLLSESLTALSRFDHVRCQSPRGALAADVEFVRCAF